MNNHSNHITHLSQKELATRSLSVPWNAGGPLGGVSFPSRLETCHVFINDLMPCKKVPDGVMSTRKYHQIVSSIPSANLVD